MLFSNFIRLQLCFPKQNFVLIYTLFILANRSLGHENVFGFNDTDGTHKWIWKLKEQIKANQIYFPIAKFPHTMLKHTYNFTIYFRPVFVVCSSALNGISPSPVCYQHTVKTARLVSCRSSALLGTGRGASLPAMTGLFINRERGNFCYNRSFVTEPHGTESVDPTVQRRQTMRYATFFVLIQYV